MRLKNGNSVMPSGPGAVFGITRVACVHNTQPGSGRALAFTVAQLAHQSGVPTPSTINQSTRVRRLPTSASVPAANKPSARRPLALAAVAHARATVAANTELTARL